MLRYSSSKCLCDLLGSGGRREGQKWTGESAAGGWEYSGECRKEGKQLEQDKNRLTAALPKEVATLVPDQAALHAR
jgi:hypothetical protein